MQSYDQRANADGLAYAGQAFGSDVTGSHILVTTLE
jgi:hypothetical protein